MEDAIARPSGVGSRLRAAREAANMTLDEVAHALKFSPRQIEHLESDNYGALPGSTIVRGFVRNYARLLKLDADALLHDLDGVIPSAPAEVRPPDNIGVASQPGGLREFSPLVSVVAVLLLAALLLVLWHFFGPTPVKSPATNGRGEAVQQPAPTATAEGAAVAAPPATSAVMPPPTEPAAGPQTMAPAQNQSPALQFVFGARSWVEVVDADKRILYSGENPANTQLTLQGRPPFDIVIGNAGAVTLSYGEHKIDLTPYMRAEVARLMVE